MDGRGSYAVYSIAVGIVWIVVLVVVAEVGSTTEFNDVGLVFLGFVIGWLSATTARYVYPPPKKHRPRHTEPN
jgi:hypothetical protein